jgi:superkiller protein 3
VEREYKVAVLLGVFTLLGTILGACIPIYYSSITSPTETYWTNKGNEYYALSDFNDAIKCYDNAIDLNPKSTAWEYKTRAFLSQKRYDEALLTFESAIKCYDNAIDLNPKSTAWEYKTRAFLSQKRYDEALLTFESAIKLTPNNTGLKDTMATVFINKGLDLDNQGKYDEAVVAYDEALHCNPDGVDAYEALTMKGLALSSLSRHNEATEAFAQGQKALAPLIS